jgi:16S rRNA G966 N2-methylase RsmD
MAKSEMKVQCAHSELVDIDLLVPNPKNANKHPKDQIKLLAKIMAHQGWRSPIVVSNRSGFITKGHGRLQAAKLNGWDKAPVDRQDYANEADEYADMVADNKIAELSDTDLSMVLKDVLDLGPDFDFDLLGIPDFKLPEEFEPQADEDEVPAAPVEPKTKRGDIYRLGRHRLMCGDSTSIDDVERLMAGEKADMVYTDPPYGMNVVQPHGKLINEGSVGIAGAAKRGTYAPIIGDDSIDTAVDAFNLCQALEIPVQVFWGANFYASKLSDSSGWICWDKENGEGFFADGELAWTNSDKQLRICRHQWKGMIKASERGEKRVHPTQKPVALAEWVFENYGGSCKSVLDLFGGSGSTLLACEKTSRRNFSMELDPLYCDVIVARWEKYTGKKAELLNG